MEHQGTNPTTPLDTHSAPEPSGGSTHQSSQTPPSQESPDLSNSWKTIGEQEDFYDEKDFLYLSCNLTSEKLKDRNEDDVVIFDYWLRPADESAPVEGGEPSSGRSREGGDIFFQVPKDRLIESEQFNQIINPTRGPQLIQSRGQRLAIM